MRTVCRRGRWFPVFVSALLCFAAARADEPIVRTAEGQLRGAQLQDPAVYVFKGIHYGRSTEGAARFKPSTRVPRWSAVKDALKFGPVCPQAGEPGRRTTTAGEQLPISEDCLVLNVWTPSIEAGGNRPVMVWLHGRGFYAGAGSEPLYDGARLARRGDAVVVTINHRLNVFGYLHLVHLGGKQFASSGNVGVQDMQLALEWVRDNIAAFGGNPQNVTIFGESGGGVKVSTLLGVPAAKGLFHRAIIQSGARTRGMPAKTALSNAQTVMAKLGVTSTADLQAVPMEKLLAAVTTTGRTDPEFGPVVDETYLPRDMFEPVAAATARGIPIMVGSNKDEHAIYAREHPLMGKMTAAQLREDLLPSFGENTDALIAAYEESRPEATPWDLMVAIRSNRFHIGTIRLAEAAAKVAPVYVYSFDFEASPLKAAHGSEIAFVFSNATTSKDARQGAKAVEDAMSEAWIAFARTGNPNHQGLPSWPTYDAQNRATMVFDTKSMVVNDLRAPERKVWEGKELVR
ncbi:MAG TPA: carboxylesterase/lipase family protein [Steroidobacter sp.]|uniref:carboxylesterase/lipase family protein n=1 Tax=Steroidobacter sp. TaxID=1978227 RepID=UPI002ED8AE68